MVFLFVTFMIPFDSVLEHILMTMTITLGLVPFTLDTQLREDEKVLRRSGELGYRER